MTPLSNTTSLKLLMITAISEDQEIITKAFKDVEIPVYSSIDIDGHQSKPEGRAITNWFAMPQPDMDAKLFFAFIPEDKVEAIVEILKKANEQDHVAHPIRSFVMDAKQAS